MHPLLTFLAGAVRYAAISADEAGPLRLVRLPDILRHICRGALNPTQIESLAYALEGHAASGRYPLPDIDEQILDLLAARPLSGRLERVAAVLHDLVVLHEALRGGQVQHVRLRVDDRLLFDMIRSLTFRQNPGEPRHVLVGTLDWAKDEQVGPFSEPSPLAQVRITYQAISLFPYLYLSVGSNSNIKSWESSRANFLHQAGQAYDLALGMRQGAARGQIKTRLLQDSWSILNARYALTLSPKLKLKLVQTIVLDADKKISMICERVVGSDKDQHT
jgi:hypothetical protein